MAASFSGFARPKTALPPETERSLTSEFGTGSGGSRALWPATEISRFLGVYKRDGENFRMHALYGKGSIHQGTTSYIGIIG